MIAPASAEESTGFTIKKETASERYTVMDGTRPVLTYNYGKVPVANGAKGKYAVARSDYVHPLYGPNGEVLTKDYSPDHPHHRGLYWAWPEVTYQGQKRDLHALQGVFARPIKLLRQEGGAKCAVLEAENEWRWSDKDPIVREKALITVHGETDGIRAIDFVFTLEALVEGVTIARRGQKAYGGFNLRFSPRREQKIRMTAPEWASLTGIPPEGKNLVSVTILQHPANPRYPGDWVQYAKLNWLQPTFPSKGEAYALGKGKPLLLRYRLLISRAELNEAAAKEAWSHFSKQKRTMPNEK